MKKIYYYNEKYPEYDIEEIKVNDEEFLVAKGYKSLCGIFANYDICCMRTSEEEYLISLYSPYENEELYVHDTSTGCHLIFSYNKQLLQEARKDDIKNNIQRLTKRLAALRKCKEG